MRRDSPVHDAIDGAAGSAAADPAGDRAPATPGMVEWRYDPWAEARAAAVASAVAVFALPALGARAGLSGAALVVTALCVFAALAQGFVPMTCRVDADGVSWRLGALPRSLRPWVRIGAAHVGRRAVRFEARARGVLARLGGVALPLPAAPPAALRPCIEGWLGRHAD